MYFQYFILYFYIKINPSYECLTHKNHIFSREIYNTIISSQNKESNDFPFSFVNLGFHLYKVEWKIFQLSIAWHIYEFFLLWILIRIIKPPIKYIYIYREREREREREEFWACTLRLFFYFIFWWDKEASYFFGESFNLWRPFLITVLYYQINTPIGF